MDNNVLVVQEVLVTRRQISGVNTCRPHGQPPQPSSPKQSRSAARTATPSSLQCEQHLAPPWDPHALFCNHGNRLASGPKKGQNVLCVILLIEVGLGYGQEAAVSLCSHGEDEGLSCEDSQVAHHLPRVGEKKQTLILAVYHTLIHVEQP